ncbi:RHS repeat-associated protein [Natronocella acetinitrilica]|uniref:RHS repeat-associated protein n=1 Tax=Natronocella acetinitrilica TaxID=414046 RepID=A0AAE3G1U9_9GAMM|nr:RHS repeat-associated core domain-containing protein [Natronocella acetinitrilica]MCP1674019.1 RHS repeat-associated protein [Natronocella acetinitrilica]
MRTITTLLLAVLLGTTHALGATETVTYYHNDALGSPVAATDEAGDVLWTQDYDAWGVTLQSHDNRRWYTGAERDEDTALTYLQARWYSAAIGRFLALDPVDFHDSNIHSFNRYAYGANNPYTYVDPDGNIPIPALVWGAVKVAGYGLAAYDAYQAYQGSGATGAAAAAGINLIGRPARAGRAVADGARRTIGLEGRGHRPRLGERTMQGQVDAATQAGNPTVQRGGRDLFRLRSSGHGYSGATATPQNIRRVTPGGRVFAGKGADRPVTRRDIRELYKAQTGQGTSTLRTRSMRKE